MPKLILVGDRRRPRGPPQDSRLQKVSEFKRLWLSLLRNRHPLSPPAAPLPVRRPRGRGAPSRGRRPVEQSGCAHKRGYGGQWEAASAVTRAPRARSIYRSYLKSPWESPWARQGGGGRCEAAVRLERVRWPGGRCQSSPYRGVGRGERARSTVAFSSFSALFLERGRKCCSFHSPFA